MDKTDTKKMTWSNKIPGCWAVPGVLPAQMLHVDARKAHIAQGHSRCSSHESFHAHQALGFLVVTERSQSPNAAWPNRQLCSRRLLTSAAREGQQLTFARD